MVAETNRFRTTDTSYEGRRRQEGKTEIENVNRGVLHALVQGFAGKWKKSKNTRISPRFAKKFEPEDREENEYY